MVVLHYTAMESCAAALERLCDPEIEVSAHYVIAESGEVFELVDEDMRAWHAGSGSWGRVTDVNSHSVGIELANAGSLANFPPFPEPQMAALEQLLANILNRWEISPERVIAHSDMAPDRKADPGTKFDWQRLARGGLSVWPERHGKVAEEDFRSLARAFGYSAVVDEAALLSAFRLRFRPGHNGPTDADDLAIIADLAARYPAGPAT